MKIKTQVIDKIEDVRFGDTVIENDKKFVASGDVYHEDNEIAAQTGEWLEFNQCTVVRITVEEAASPEFTQAQAQEMYEMLERIMGNSIKLLHQ